MLRRQGDPVAGGNEVDEQTSNSRFTMMQHEQDSLSNPRPPIRVDERPLQKRYSCITADDARAVFVGGNEVDESRDTGQRTQPKRKAKMVHPKTDAQPKNHTVCLQEPTKTMSFMV